MPTINRNAVDPAFEDAEAATAAEAEKAAADALAASAAAAAVATTAADVAAASETESGDPRSEGVARRIDRIEDLESSRPEGANGPSIPLPKGRRGRQPRRGAIRSASQLGGRGSRQRCRRGGRGPLCP